MTEAERDILRSAALQMCADAAIAAGGDLAFRRNPIVKSLQRRGAGRTFSYAVVASLIDEGDVEREMERRLAVVRSSPANVKTVSLPGLPDGFSERLAEMFKLLDKAGELFGELVDRTDADGAELAMEGMRATEAVEALLRPLQSRKPSVAEDFA